VSRLPELEAITGSDKLRYNEVHPCSLFTLIISKKCEKSVFIKIIILSFSKYWFRHHAERVVVKYIEINRLDTIWARILRYFCLCRLKIEKKILF
jgi:hypothetical protein